MEQKAKDDYAARAAKFGFVSREKINARCLQEGTVFIDLRSEAEVAEQRLPGPWTLNIPLAKDDPLTDYSKVTEAHALCFAEKRDAPILVFCRSGARAAFAKKALEEVLCYSDVINGGGMKDLIKSGGGPFANALAPCPPL